MLTLGLSGGLDPVHEQVLDVPENYTYDGAAVLVRDGRVVAAVEEERLNRIKHSNKFPFESIRFCLDSFGLRATDLDRIGYYVNEEAANVLLSRLALARPELAGDVDARTLLAGTLSRGLGCEIDPGRLAFFQHKLTHAASAMAHSGFDDGLVHVVDSASGLYSGSWDERGGLRLDELVAWPHRQSLNHFSQTLLPAIGLGMFDEHKMVALAAQGDPATFAPVFDQLCELLPGGDYALRLDRAAAVSDLVGTGPRTDPPDQAVRDVAASMQHTMERIVLHQLRHYREKAGHRRLCMAGGMIENTGLAGKVLRSGLFDEVFVHPAAYDTGCAVGAALLASSEGADAVRQERPVHVFWGPDVGSEPEVAAVLDRWRGFVSAHRSPDVARDAAQLLADGAVVGWVQGRSEFGSHALGNRSVLADPRNPESRPRVNKALSRAEVYRPLAPSVLAEDAHEYFVLPPGMAQSPFMTFAVEVRADRRAALPATTQADGTARLHTVSREANLRYWELISAFRDITGVPVLLNTSFNNSVEPTVHSAEDAVVSFLTTEIDHLVVGDFVVRRREPAEQDWLALGLSVPPHVKLFQIKGHAERERATTRCELRTSYEPQVRRRVSPELGALLGTVNAETPLGELMSAISAPDREQILAEIRQLWAERMLSLRARSS
ncbi:carbamoyltransferase family protein [Saccharopolyspora taberi]|uniref:Carbamoyltransferase n=1 Tax=Saccharopolyspora taberi TaxID=60895 RepID=A0ABN3VEX9_9PSEU